MNQELDAGYWTDRYRNADTGWDIGYASPAITGFVEQYYSRHTRILIPGAGNAWEAEYLFRAGYTDITVLDISEEPLKQLRQRMPEFPSGKLVCADFFEHTATYDLILEQTFFCALNPALRRAYVQKMHSLLNEGGELAGLWFALEFETEGPPFGGTLEEYLATFEPFFVCAEAGISAQSVKPRAGRELFIRWKPKIR